ncbi:uncharacterized protein LOC120107009 [Phoenix dactylifera]|uniref:Uncharacterized protein LOC103704395 n=1 Tax=Phoenix dactylifera TaxID=42345 RepID=A0A8B8ZX15_PHODC|nr:uncharacterized protein LOC103704395 [Phoenix dactylifera]XP_038976083.1 uncharacterized protein LOC120107009 [Phoenix dactylifera]
MDGYREDYLCCYFHPKEVVVGICALCLKERLLSLAAKQGHLPLSKDTQKSFRVLRRKPNITLPKVFALGSFLHRIESRRPRPDDGSDEGSIASLEDSFISIKFEDNGHASWDNKKAASMNPTMNTISITTDKIQAPGKERPRSMVEHAKARGMLRWRKRIGHLLQLARWKRSSKAGTCHVALGGKVEGAKGRRGWIRNLTRRRTATIG